MPTSAPPFRADHVGSLLRPAEIKQARARNAEGKLGQARACGDRGRGHQAHHRAPGGDRARGCHRRRVPPRRLALGLPRRPRRRRVHDRIGGARVQGRDDGADVDQGRRARSTSAVIPCSGTTASCAAARGSRRKCAFRRPLIWPASRATGAASSTARSIPSSIRCSMILRSPIARRSAPLPMPAAATCSSTTATSPSCAIPPCGNDSSSRATIRRRCCARSRSWSRIRSPSGRPG